MNTAWTKALARGKSDPNPDPVAQRYEDGQSIARKHISRASEAQPHSKRSTYHTECATLSQKPITAWLHGLDHSVGLHGAMQDSYYRAMETTSITPATLNCITDNKLQFLVLLSTLLTRKTLIHTHDILITVPQDRYSRCGRTGRKANHAYLPCKPGPLTL